MSQSHGSAIGESHAFTSADGVDWLVREYVDIESAALRPSLVFESDAAIRRVRVFPADWRGLSPQELMDLSWKV